MTTSRSTVASTEAATPRAVGSPGQVAIKIDHMKSNVLLLEAFADAEGVDGNPKEAVSYELRRNSLHRGAYKPASADRIALSLSTALEDSAPEPAARSRLRSPSDGLVARADRRHMA